MPYNVARITRRNFKTGYGEPNAWNTFSKSRTTNPDGSKKTCATCGTKGSKENPIQAGHKISITRGGRNTKLNTDAQCKRCNDRQARRL